MSSFRPFGLTAWLAAPIAAALLMPVSLSPARAQAVAVAPTAPQAANPAPGPQTATTATSRQESPEQRGLTARAIDRVKQVAKSAGDIFSRVPCLPPKGATKGGARSMGSLPHVASKLVAGKPVVIVAFGS